MFNLFGNKEDRVFHKEERNFIENLSKYLQKNCRAVYGFEYIPRLAQKICQSQNIELELYHGYIYLKQDKLTYKIPYICNMYKGYVIDLNLFVLKAAYKKSSDKPEGSLNEEELFPSLPPYLISNFENNKELDFIDDISYEMDNIIMGNNFQPPKILEDDKLLLAVYNDCYARKIAREVLNFKSDKEPINLKLEMISVITVKGWEEDE